MIPIFSRMFPGTNLQDLNLDWIVRRIMELSKGIIAPWINAQNQHWMVYDTAAETFVDSGVSAAGEGTGPQGEPGKSPVIGSNGNWYTWDTTTQAYTDTGTQAEGPVGPQGPQGPIGDGIAASDYAVVIEGNQSVTGAFAGQYVYLKNSTISGKADGLYKAVLAIPANTSIDETYLSTIISRGGMNDINSRLSAYGKTLWTGDFSGDGSITVPELSNYLLIVIKPTNSLYNLIGTRGRGGTLFGSYNADTVENLGYRFSTAGNTITVSATDRGIYIGSSTTHGDGAECHIKEIIGLIPIIQ